MIYTVVFFFSFSIRKLSLRRLFPRLLFYYYFLKRNSKKIVNDWKKKKNRALPKRKMTDGLCFGINVRVLWLCEKYVFCGVLYRFSTSICKHVHDNRDEDSKFNSDNNNRRIVFSSYSPLRECRFSIELSPESSVDYDTLALKTARKKKHPVSDYHFGYNFSLICLVDSSLARTDGLQLHVCFFFFCSIPPGFVIFCTIHNTPIFFTTTRVVRFFFRPFFFSDWLLMNNLVWREKNRNRIIFFFFFITISRVNCNCTRECVYSLKFNSHIMSSTEIK